VQATIDLLFCGKTYIIKEEDHPEKMIVGERICFDFVIVCGAFLVKKRVALLRCDF